MVAARSGFASTRAALGNASRGPVTLGRFGFTSTADTETLTSLEGGFKATLMDGRARWSSAVYTFGIDDQQLTATGGTGNRAGAATPLYPRDRCAELAAAPRLTRAPRIGSHGARHA